jgi:transposase
VDRLFRTHGPYRERRLYRKRTSIERVFSRLKRELTFERHNVKGLRNIAIHVLLCIITLLLVATTALHVGKPEKARSVTLLR